MFNPQTADWSRFARVATGGCQRCRFGVERHQVEHVCEALRFGRYHICILDDDQDCHDPMTGCSRYELEGCRR